MVHVVSISFVFFHKGKSVGNLCILFRQGFFCPLSYEGYKHRELCSSSRLVAVVVCS